MQHLALLITVMFFVGFTACNRPTNRGKVVYGEGGAIEYGIGRAYCDPPQKRYANSISATVDAQISPIESLPENQIEANLKKSVVRLTDYSSQGLDIDLILYRICEISINRGFSQERTDKLIQLAIASWNNSIERPKGDAREGVLKSSIENEGTISFKSGPYNMTIGSIIDGETGENVKEFDVSGFLGFDPERGPFKVMLKDESLYLTANLFDLDGKLVGKIEDNKWFINVNNYFNYYFRDDRIEILDQYGVPVIQVLFENSRTIKVNGAFNLGSQILFLRDSNQDWLDVTPKGRQQIEDNENISIVDRYKEIGNKLQLINRD